MEQGLPDVDQPAVASGSLAEPEEPALKRARPSAKVLSETVGRLNQFRALHLLKNSDLSASNAVPVESRVDQFEQFWKIVNYPNENDSWRAELWVLMDQTAQRRVESNLGGLTSSLTYWDLKTAIIQTYAVSQAEKKKRFEAILNQPRLDDISPKEFVAMWQTAVAEWKATYETHYRHIFLLRVKQKLEVRVKDINTWKEFFDYAYEVVALAEQRAEELELQEDQRLLELGRATSEARKRKPLEAEAPVVESLNAMTVRDSNGRVHSAGGRGRGGNRSRNRGRSGRSQPKISGNWCYVCGHRDHYAPDCPNKRTEPADGRGSSMNTDLSYPTPQPKASLPHNAANAYVFVLALSVPGREEVGVVTLIDTGATRTCIDGEVVRRLGIPTFVTKPREILTPFSVTQTTLTGCRFTLSLSNWRGQVEALVVSGLGETLYLGTDFTKVHGSHLNLKTATFAGQRSIGKFPRGLEDLTPENLAPIGVSDNELVEQTNQEWFIVEAREVTTIETEPQEAVSAVEKVSLATITTQEMLLESEAAPARRRVLTRFGHLLKESLDVDEHVSEAIDPYVIKLKPGATGTKLPQFRLTWEEHQEVNRTVREWLALGIIERSTSPFNVAVFLVDKDGGKSKRLVMNFRPLNELTEDPFGYLPVTEDILARIGAARPKVFAKIDLTLGYLQVPLAKESREYTAFSTLLGRFQFVRLPFGLALAPSFFHTMITEILGELLEDKVAVYLDDVILWGSDVPTLERLLTRVLTRFEEYNLVLHSKKCLFFMSRVVFLGHEVSSSGIGPDKRKTDAVARWPVPKTIKDCQVFLGMANYLRKFIKDFSKIARPINDFVARRVPTFGEEQKIAFEELRKRLVSAPVLVHPDRSQSFELETDASQFQAGGILWLRATSSPRRRLGVVGYFSRTFSETESRYSAREREILAAVLLFEHWRYLLAGVHVVLFVDHKSFAQKVAPAGRVAGFIDRFAPFSFTVKWRSGALNVAADALSRVALPMGTSILAPLTAEEPDHDDRTDEPEGELPSLLDDLEIVDDPDLEVNRHEPRPTSRIEEVLRHLQLTESEYDQISLAYAADKAFKGWWQELAEGEQKVRTTFTMRRQANLLWRKGEEGIWRLCLPNVPFRRRMVATAHESGGHMLLGSTATAVMKLFYWRGIWSDTETWARSCDICQRTKRLTGPRPGEFRVVAPPGGPWTNLCLDFATLSHYSVYNGRQVNGVMLVIDRFTRWVVIEPFLFAMGESDAPAVWSALERRVFSQNGLPKSILSDNDVRFSGWYKDQAKARGISLRFTSKHHPQTNGLAERHIGLMKQAFRTLAFGENSNWGQYVHHAEFLLNNFRRDSLNGLTPFEVSRGYSPRGGRFSWNRLQSPETLRGIMSNFEALRGVTRDLLAEAAAAMEKLQERSRRPFRLEQNQRVLVRRSVLGTTLNRGTSKLTPAWVGPFEVLSADSNAIILRNPPGRSLPRVNAADVRPYHEPIEEFAPRMVPQSHEEMVQRILEVASLVRIDPERLVVMTTWEGCSERHLTAVPYWVFAHMDDAMFWELALESPGIKEGNAEDFRALRIVRQATQSRWEAAALRRRSNEIGDDLPAVPSVGDDHFEVAEGVGVHSREGITSPAGSRGATDPGADVGVVSGS